MIRPIRSLCGNATGVAAIEFAISVPALVMIIWGLFQVGIIYQANAGIQHALGEAARFATIYPTPSDDDIQEMITEHKFGLANGTWDEPEIDNTNIAPADGGYKTITVSYTMPTDFLFFDGPDVTITKSKDVYLSI